MGSDSSERVESIGLERDVRSERKRDAKDNYNVFD